MDNAVLERLQRGADMMDSALQMATDLDALNRKLVTYWSIATHMLPHVKTFPLLVLKGPMGTGKSECLSIVSRFAHKSRMFPMRGYTSAMIRDEMIKAYEGTAVIEEADQGWKDGDTSVERILSDRYQRNTGVAGVKHKNQREEWTNVALPIFGATAIHRRIPFADAALDGRSITISFRSNFDRSYTDTEALPWITDGEAAVKDVVFSPVEVDRPLTIAPRIFNSYNPVIATSRTLNDNPFFYDLIERLELETRELKTAQSLEPDGIVLRAVLNIVSEAVPTYGNIKISTVAEWIYTNHKMKFAPRQVAGLARALGLILKESHGVTVIVPTASTLARACRMVGYHDEDEIVEMQSKIPGWCSFLEDSDGG